MSLSKHKDEKTTRCHACRFSKLSIPDIRCRHFMHPGVVAIVDSTDGKWYFVSGRSDKARCVHFEA